MDGRHFGMDGLHHHDSIIHHNTNGQYECKQSKQVDTETKQLHEEEGTNDSYRHSDGRDQRRAEILQEDEHHNKHEDECFYQGGFHLADRFI
jgi:hypothetical protein